MDCFSPLEVFRGDLGEFSSEVQERKCIPHVENTHQQG